MKILLADQLVLFREGLQSLLGREPDMEVVGQTGSFLEAVEQAVQLEPNLVLTDLYLLDGSGLDLLRTIRTRHLGCRVVILSDHASNEHILEAVQSGANGYVLKNTPFDSLLAALRAVWRGEPLLSRPLIRQIVDQNFRHGDRDDLASVSLEVLTLRELEVLREVGAGHSNREIADHLVISEHTVKVHVRNILDKLRLNKRSQIISAARRIPVGLSSPQLFS
jgi:two-component system NarL family response regulator